MNAARSWQRPGPQPRRFECGVCWEVYDPARGDPEWQVPAGTPFEALPAHWSCPRCAAERDRFLELDDE